MSKDQTDTHLRFGQGIIIKGYKPQGDPDEGFMTVRGFADTRANYQTSSDILYFKNYRNCIFEFLPAGNFEINDELYKLQSKVIDGSDDEQERKKTLETLQARAKSQQAQFELGIKRKLKSTIKFGDYIMLRHVDSQTYLSGTIRPSDGTNGAFSVEVSNRLSKSLVFQLLPYRSFEAESMQIPFSSPVLIKNVYNNGFLTFEKLGLGIDTSNLNKYMEKVPTLSDQSYKIPVKTSTRDSRVYEVVTHFVDLSIEIDQKMPWQFQLHFKEVQNDSLIQHDIVYLRHTSNNGILSAVGQDIVLKQLKHESSQGLSFYESLWQIQKYTDAARLYILRHLMSGMTLGVQKNHDGEPEQAILIDISQGPEGGPLGSVQLKLAKKDGGQINSESFISICDGEYTLDIAPEGDEQELDKSLLRSSTLNRDEGLVNLKKMKKLAKNQLQFEVKKLAFSSDISTNCFVIQEIDDDLKKELLFALSFHSTIINLREDLKWGATDAMKKVSYIRMMRVTQKIAQINDFLKGCESNDPQKQLKHPIYKRQMICKDLGLSELLFELLFYIRQNMRQEIFKEKINEKQKFYEMHQTIYRVIINLIKDNKIFKIHVSRWILFIIEDFIQRGQEIHVQTLMELLKNNQFFVQNFVNGGIIDYLLQAMLKQRNNKGFTQKRYIDVLRAFCIVGQKVFSLNQGLVLKYFIEKLEVNPEGLIYQIKFIQHENDILCKVALDKRTTIEYKFEQFKQLAKEVDSNGMQKYPNAWQYYTAYVNLMADLTKGRNKSVEKYAGREFPLQLLSQLFDNYDISEFSVPIIKILHYLYSQNENFYPIDKQRRIVAYDAIESTQIHINHFSGALSPWSSMQRVLNKLITKLSQAEPILPANYSQNQILFQLLLLVLQTLNLGFWLRKEDLEKIYTNILHILHKHDELDYEEACKNNKENELMIACKIECLNIIDMIINQDMDMSLQICNKVFKEYEIPLPGDYDKQNANVLGSSSNQLGYAIEFNEKIEEKSGENNLIVNIDIYDQMLELSKYNNPALTSKSLAILYRVLDYKRHRITKFYEQLFVCEPDCVMLAQYLNNLKNKFFTLEDINTTKITYDNQAENYFPIYNKEQSAYKESSNTGIMQDMYMITQLMKNENSLSHLAEIPTLDSSGVYERLGTQALINFTDCRKSSSLTKQKIVDAANIHIKILSYITNCHEIPDSQLALKLLHLCYKVIVGLIENHQEMKPKIIPYLPIMMGHLNKNIGCIDLLKQMYDNNKNMLYNEAQIQVLIRTICDQIDKETNILYKAKLLDFFRYLIYLNNKCLRNNQILILKIMQDDDYSNILESINVQRIKHEVSVFKEDNADGEYPDDIVKLQPQLVYLCTYFQIIASLIDQNNTVNIGKLIKRFPFDLLAECIILCEDCWILKRNIRCVINKLYYFEVGTNVYLSTIINKEIPTIIDDLDRFISIKYKAEDEVSRLEGLVLENPVRFTYLESYFYLNLEENLFSMFSMLNTSELYDELASILKGLNTASDFSNNIIRITQRLGEIRRYFTKHQNVTTTALIKFLQFRLKGLLEAIRVEIYEPGLKGKISSMGMSNMTKSKDKEIRGRRESMQKSNVEDEQKAKNYIIEKILDGDIGQLYANKSQKYRIKQPLTYLTENKSAQVKVVRERDDRKLSNLLRQIFTRRKREFTNRDEEISSKLEKIVSALKMSKDVNRRFIQSFQNNISECYSKNEGSGQEELLNYITVQIKINEDDPEVLSEELKIFILKLINTLFYEANKKKQAGSGEIKTIKKQAEQPKQQPKQQHMGEHAVEPVKQPEAEPESAPEPKQIDEWQAEDWEHSSQDINKLQLSLKDCGIGSFITSLIKGNICNNISLANSILLCSISYMLGGNKQTQNNIREQLNKDPENKLLMNIKKLINKLGSLIRKNIDEQHNANKNEEYISEFIITNIDNYDFYDKEKKFVTRKNVSQPHYVDQIIYYKECIITYRRAFKFLQLLCENNNIDNKNFIREQPSTSESIDFIEIATKQLRNIFQVFCTDIEEVPIFILDFILQVTQIPVKLNQDALIKSSFFQDVCLLATCMSKEEQVRERGFEKNREPVDEVFQKCVHIILSNFQGNDKDYFKLLDDKLDTTFLTKLLKQKLQMINIKTKADFQKYIEDMTAPKLDEQGNLSACTIYDESITSILQIIIIFMKLRDIVGESSRVYAAYLKEKGAKAKNEKKINQELFDALEKCLLKIQINDYKNKTQDVYFPKLPVFSSISAGLKDYVMSQVTRKTHRQKIISLLGFVEDIRSKINQAYTFEKCEHTSQQVMSTYYKYSGYWSIIICFYMILFYNVYIEYGTAEYTSSWLIVIVRFIFSLIQFRYSILYGYTWYKLKVWVKPERKSRQSKQAEETVSKVLEMSMELSKRYQNQNPIQLTKLQKFKNNFDATISQAREKFPYFGQIVDGLKQAKQAFFPSDPDAPKVHASGEFYKIFIYILVSFIATFIYPPIIFVHLIDLICSVQTLGNIFQAIGLVTQQLFYVSLMGVVFVIVFSMITFSNYMKDVYAEVKDQNEMCEGPISCILALFVSGAIGETMSKFEIVRFLFDMIYIIFFGLLFGNIISGLMLDAFGELAQNSESLQDDKKNKCYICNISREKLQKSGEMFEDHVLKKHYLWNYIFYIIALEKKNQTDYTGLEYYISQKYNLPDEEMDVTWIPNGEESSFEKEPFAQEMVDNLNAALEENAESVSSLNAKIDEFVNLAQELEKA